MNNNDTVLELIVELSPEERQRTIATGAIRIARLRARLNQPAFADALARRLGRRISRHAVSGWEAEKIPIPNDVLAAAAELARVEVEDLLRHGERMAEIYRMLEGQARRQGRDWGRADHVMSAPRAPRPPRPRRPQLYVVSS